MGLASLASYDFGSRRTFPTGVTLISKPYAKDDLARRLAQLLTPGATFAAGG